MASIQKRKTKTGEVRYRVMWRVDGRLVEERFSTYAAARAKKREIEAMELDGRTTDPAAGARALNEYFDEWLQSRLVRGRPLRPGTRYGYQQLWKRTIRETIGTKQLRDLRPEGVRSWHSAALADAGHAQAAKAYRLLRAVLATAETDELIRSNPCRIRGAGQEHAPERPLPPTELVLTLAELIGDRYRALVLLVGFASLRTGEALGLRRRDVDLLHNTVTVAGQAQEIAGVGRIRLEEAKNDAGRRTISIPRPIADAVAEHLDRFTDADPEAPVFTGPGGGPLPRETLSKVWPEAKAKAGAPEGLRLYDLRHHAGTIAARMPGVTTKELMARIGHSSFRAALIYQHAAEERDQAIAAFLEQEIAKARPTPIAPVVDLTLRSRWPGVGSEPDGTDFQERGNPSDQDFSESGRPESNRHHELGRLRFCL